MTSSNFMDTSGCKPACNIHPGDETSLCILSFMNQIMMIKMVIEFGTCVPFVRSPQSSRCPFATHVMNNVIPTCQTFVGSLRRGQHVLLTRPNRNPVKHFTICCGHASDLLPEVMIMMRHQKLVKCQLH